MTQPAKILMAAALLAWILLLGFSWGQTPCIPGWHPVAPGSNCCTATPAPPPQGCVQVHQGFWDGGPCVETATCTYQVGAYGAGYYGSFCSNTEPPPPPPPTTCTATIPAFVGCPVHTIPDALNPAGSWWLFYSYRIVGFSPNGKAITVTPVGTYSPGLNQQFHPNRYMTWNCRAAGNFRANFRGWPLPPSYICGDQGFSQPCTSASDWCLNPAVPGGHVYKGQ